MYVRMCAEGGLARRHYFHGAALGEYPTPTSSLGVPITKGSWRGCNAMAFSMTTSMMMNEVRPPM